MQIRVAGKQIDIGDALKTHIEEALTGVISKYFNNTIEANVIISKEGYLTGAIITTHMGKGLDVRGHADGETPYVAFDKALEKLEHRLRKYKNRLRDHHKKDKEHESVTAAQYVLETAEVEDVPEAAPAVIAELTAVIPTLSVSEAVMRFDLAAVPVLMFRNSAHGGYNIIYRRTDGNIGWIDPEGESNPSRLMA
ncbi:MAG: ribosome-associated translation inhibitor RaiA [Alphaproteobacteria bacterium]|nr:ribosome-associated translation inhibitor RaiA [Alphaproteobacteria bacterium]MBT5389194.1 ribosome-associated translation inhibitor RaiA [Alphaproteobacteria bacterium]MBT5540374.1 ribosome-associated translation inhibitor RaiA [Alphaproteobacteria bacterium]MBT5654251.1 ribosome-associated translation inhibitor RaiA [Alphaproteobacteria bacterium]